MANITITPAVAVLAVAAAGCGAPPPAPPPPTPAVSPHAGSAADGRLVLRLTSNDVETQRLALSELSVRREPWLVPHVVRCLRSPDAIVRHQAATVLGDWHALDAVPALVELLDDEAPFVRCGAHASLQRITGRDRPFDPAGTREQRRTAQREWLAWWHGRAARPAGR